MSQYKQGNQLFPTITPEKYIVSLRPDMTNSTFIGQETILFNTPNKLSTYTFHALDIVVEKATLVARNEIYATKISYNHNEQTVTFTIPDEARPGRKELSLTYSGVLNDRMKDWYRSELLREGEKHVLAVTQFEEIGGRQTFVCIDEPLAKAVLEVSVVLP